jgi:hypothetical protein
LERPEPPAIHVAASVAIHGALHSSDECDHVQSLCDHEWMDDPPRKVGKRHASRAREKATLMVAIVTLPAIANGNSDPKAWWCMYGLGSVRASISRVSPTPAIVAWRAKCRGDNAVAAYARRVCLSGKPRAEPVRERNHLSRGGQAGP